MLNGQGFADKALFAFVFVMHLPENPGYAHTVTPHIGASRGSWNLVYGPAHQSALSRVRCM